MMVMAMTALAGCAVAAAGLCAGLVAVNAALLLVLRSRIPQTHFQNLES